MNKFIKKAMALALAGTMTMGMSVTTLAANSNLNTDRETINDTGEINLLKDYVNGSTSQTGTKSPAETFTFKIERYGLWNVGEDGFGKAKYTISNMPTFDNGNTTGSTNTFTIKADAGKAGNTVEEKLSTKINVPTYDAVGDYWYKVTETDNNVAGVIYGTNDNQADDLTKENNNHDAVYYIHVQVTNAEQKGEYVRTVTLHKTAPDSTKTKNEDYEKWYAENNVNDTEQTKKANDIQNKYYAGSLGIKKTVTGNAGDKKELFKVTVEFDNESGASMNSDITYKNFFDENGNVISEPTSLSWIDTVTGNNHSQKTFSKDFYVKDGTTVQFDNIPYGVSYTITETQPADDKYIHSFAYNAYTDGKTNQDQAGTFNGVATAADTVSAEGTEGTKEVKWNAAKATGSISDDLDTVTITNNKESVIDVGVITSNAPYVAILVFAGVMMVLYVRRRKDMIEE